MGFDQCHAKVLFSLYGFPGQVAAGDRFSSCSHQACIHHVHPDRNCSPEAPAKARQHSGVRHRVRPHKCSACGWHEVGIKVQACLVQEWYS